MEPHFKERSSDWKEWEKSWDKFDSMVEIGIKLSESGTEPRVWRWTFVEGGKNADCWWKNNCGGGMLAVCTVRLLCGCTVQSSSAYLASSQALFHPQQHTRDIPFLHQHAYQLQGTHFFRHPQGIPVLLPYPFQSYPHQPFPYQHLGTHCLYYHPGMTVAIR